MRLQSSSQHCICVLVSAALFVLSTVCAMVFVASSMSGPADSQKYLAGRGCARLQKSTLLAARGLGVLVTSSCSCRAVCSWCTGDRRASSQSCWAAEPAQDARLGRPWLFCFLRMVLVFQVPHIASWQGTNQKRVCKPWHAAKSSCERFLEQVACDKTPFAGGRQRDPSVKGCAMAAALRICAPWKLWPETCTSS